MGRYAVMFNMVSLMSPAGAAGYQLEHLGSLPCVHSCKPVGFLLA